MGNDAITPLGFPAARRFSSWYDAQRQIHQRRACQFENPKTLRIELCMANRISEVVNEPSERRLRIDFPAQSHFMHLEIFVFEVISYFIEFLYVRLCCFLKRFVENIFARQNRPRNGQFCELSNSVLKGQGCSVLNI